MKKTLSSQLIKSARLPAVTASDAVNGVSTICDMGDCQNAVAIIDFEFTTHNVSDVKFWTSSSDTDCVTSGTARTATTNTVQVVVASDDDSLQAWNGNTRVTNLSVSSAGTLADLAQDCAVAIELPNIRRYLAAEWVGTGVSSTMGITFIGRDPSGSDRPWTAARSAY